MNEFVIATSGLRNFGQLAVVLISFIFVVALTYWSSRWIANYQKSLSQGKNIEVIEISRLTNNKYLEIIKVGNQYILIAVCKDTVTKLLEINEEQLSFAEAEIKGGTEPFEIILNKIKNLKQKEK